MSTHNPNALDESAGKRRTELVDEFNNPLTPSAGPSIFQRIGSFGAKGPALVAFLIAITVLLLNLGSLIDRFSPVEKQTFELAVKASNSTDAAIELNLLLDYHLTRITLSHRAINGRRVPTSNWMMRTLRQPALREMVALSANGGNDTLALTNCYHAPGLHDSFAVAFCITLVIVM